MAVLGGFQLTDWFSLLCLIFSYFFACVVNWISLIVNFVLLGAEYFCIPVNTLELFREEKWRCSWAYLETVLSFQILCLRFVRQYQSRAPPRANYFQLLRQYPSELSTQCPMNCEVFPVWPEGIGTIPGSVWVPGTAVFLPMFFHRFFLQFREQDLLFCIAQSLEHCSQILPNQYHPHKCETGEGSSWDKCPSFVISQHPVTPLL